MKTRTPGSSGVVLEPVPSLRRNAAWNLGGSLAPLLAGVVTIPYLIRQMGVESFGILTLVWALIGYFSVFDFGLGRALTQQVSAHRSDGLADEVPALVKPGLLFTLISGSVGGVILAVAAHRLGYSWLNVTPGLQQVTTDSLRVAALGIPLSTVTSGLKGVLEGYEDFRISSMLRIVLGVMTFGFPALTAALFTPSLLYMVCSLVLARMAILVAHAVAVNRRLPGWGIARPAPHSAQRTTALLSFGAWMTVSNIISPLMVNADRFVISFLLGASVVAYYTVPFEIVIRALVIPAALTAALFPRFAYLFRRDVAGGRLLYRKSLRSVAAIMVTISLVFAAGSYPALTLWLGRPFAERSWMIAAVLSVGLLFNSLALVPHAAIQAAGAVRTTTLIHVAEFVLYVPVLFLALRLYGLIGAALVWVLRVMADFLMLSYCAARELP